MKVRKQSKDTKNLIKKSGRSGGQMLSWRHNLFLFSSQKSRTGCNSINFELVSLRFTIFSTIPLERSSFWEWVSLSVADKNPMPGHSGHRTTGRLNEKQGKYHFFWKNVLKMPTIRESFKWGLGLRFYKDTSFTKKTIIKLEESNNLNITLRSSLNFHIFRLFIFTTI